MSTGIKISRDKRNKGKPWAVRWTGEFNPHTGGQRCYCKSFRIKADAETFKAEKAVEFGKGGSRDKPKQVVLGDYLEEWLRIKRSSIRPKTAVLYEDTINRLRSFGNMPLSKLTPGLADSFIAELQPQRGETLSNWTRDRALRNCKHIFRKAVKRGYLPSNPFADVESPKCVTRPWHYVTPGEFGRLLDAAPNLRWQAVYSLAYTAGLRFGELFQLMWSDVDFETGEVRIQNRPATAKLPLFHIKNGKPRVIQLSRHTLDILTAWQAEQPEGIPYILLDQRQYDAVLSKWLVYREQGRPFENTDMVNNVGREFNRHFRRAGIKPIGTLSLHTLRKCAGKNWSSVNRDPAVTMKLMGHSSLATTLKFYDQVTAEDRARAADAIDALLNKKDVFGTYEANLAQNRSEGQL